MSSQFESQPARPVLDLVSDSEGPSQLVEKRKRSTSPPSPGALSAKTLKWPSPPGSSSFLQAVDPERLPLAEMPDGGTLRLGLGESETYDLANKSDRKVRNLKSGGGHGGGGDDRARGRPRARSLPVAMPPLMYDVEDVKRYPVPVRARFWST